MKARVCLFGTARYGRHLSPTIDRKFGLLADLADVHVVAFADGPRPCRFTRHARFVLLPAPRSAVARQLLFFTVAPAVLAWLVLVRGVELVVAQGPYEAAAVAPVKRLARALGRRVAVAVESHGDFERSLFLYRRPRFPRAWRAAMRGALRVAARHADVLRAVSDATRRQLERAIPGPPVVQFPTWTDIGAFRHARSAVSRDATPLALYAGALTPLKGVHHLVRAFAGAAGRLPVARLVVVGHEMDPAYAADLRRLVADLGLASRVTFSPPLAQAELAVWMRRAWAVVLPSLSEGMPRVVLEAMAAGTAVVATRTGGIPEVVEEGVTGHLVEPSDVAGLADALSAVLGDREHADALGARAAAAADRGFSEQRYVQGYADMIAAARVATEAAA